MKRIVVFGAGRSSIYLIEYLLKYIEEKGGTIDVYDRDLELAKDKIGDHPQANAYSIDILNANVRRNAIKGADVVVSMVPHMFHIEVAKDCLKLGVHMSTASYVSEEMQSLHNEAKRKGLIFLNELGVDPGIDHLSAMEIIDNIKEKGGEISEFESFTGGLVAPEFENNPWKYKFTWNPRNVVLAAQGGAVKFIHNGKYKYIPYHKVFRRTEIVEIPGYGKYEGYANRDSLKYCETYGLEGVKTMYRGTFRRPGFCRAWNCFVQLGATDDSYKLEDSENMTHRDFINTFLSYHPTDSVELKLRQYLKIDQDDVDLWERLEYLGIFEDTKVGLANATPAQILEHILKKKWELDADDKDMIVMWHKFVYSLNGEEHTYKTSLVVEGESHEKTAMAKTVGLPLAIGTKYVLDDKIQDRGVLLPIKKDLYEPIIKELKEQGIEFVKIT
jgi:saccharopine dehydrogenase-like NADP-dependent oxidoreductase